MSFGLRRTARGKKGALGSLLAFAVMASFGLAAVARSAAAQTLARPRWAGSGMTVERWWQGAVLYTVHPGEATDGAGLLEELTGRLDDLQALGVDAILLREVDGSGAASPSRETAISPAPPGSAAPLSVQYGSVEQFDRLLSEASRRRLRILVELPGPALAGDALVGRARFWLSRGVTGLYLNSGAVPGRAASDRVTDARAQVRALRSVLRGFVGERVLLGDAAAFETGPGPAGGGPERPERERTIHGTNSSNRDAPDLLLTPLRGLGGGELNLAALRGALEAVAGRSAGSASVSEVNRVTPPGSAAEARAVTTVLLSARGSIALGAEHIATSAGDRVVSPAGHSSSSGSAVASSVVARSAATPPADPLFAWTSRMIGLHRGNATMRDGVQSVLDHDAEGALVLVWRGGGTRPQVLIEIVNLTDKPLQLSLVDDAARLRLRGSFLRTVLRSDAGMGAMPLRAVSLPGYGVYLGELGR